MTLYEALQKATSEEDVKAAYIRALGRKNVQRNLIDIQTKEVWFEAKSGSRRSVYFMFTQLLNYVWVALRDGEEIPPFLCVVDSVKAALIKTEVALPLLKDKSVNIKWGKSASDVTPEAQDVVSQYIGTHFVTFRIETQEREFAVEYANIAGRNCGYAITTPGGSVVRRNVNRDGSRRDLINSCSTTFNGALLDSHTYTYDALSRPTARTSGGVASTFAYNERGEVVSAQIGSSLFAHGYDHIGNHTLFAANAATNTFTHNNLNQTTSSLCGSA